MNRFPLYRCLKLATVAALGLAATLPAAAQNYPTRAVRIIAPFLAGGSSDLVARILAQKLTETNGQQFIVDNRPGAGGTLGTEIASKAAPDGYTLSVGTSPQQYAAFIKAEVDKVAKIAKAIGLQPE